VLTPLAKNARKALSEDHTRNVMENVSSGFTDNSSLSNRVFDLHVAKDCTSSEQLQADPVAPPGFPAGSLMPIMGAPIGFPPFYHGGIPPFVSGGNGKLGDNGPAFVQQIYVMAPPPPQIAQEGGATTYAHSQYYPTAFMPYTQPYHAYMLPHSVARGDGQMITPPPYAYQPSYGKMVSVEPASNDHNSRRNT
jgi:hypothetical protein